MAHSANKLKLFDPAQYPAEQHFLIAYSGGSDSTALLHFCAHHNQLKGRIRAIHINHQIQAESNDWQKHCESQCHAWQIPLVTTRVCLDDDSENSARNARRQAFMQHLKTNEILLTGHHQQDQVETVLFRLFRGTGIKGLGGISNHSQLPQGQHISRPLLGLRKQHIIEYLHAFKLIWLEDPSNQSSRYSRNHIRHQFLPSIQAYSEHAYDAICQTAEHLQHSHRLLMRLMPEDNPLPLINDIDATYLHHWLQKKGVYPPGIHQLENFMTSCKQAAQHKHPELNWSTMRLIYWHHQFFLLHQAPQTKDTVLPFQPCMSLPCGGQLLFSEPMDISCLQIKYQVTGTRLKLAQHAHHKTVKKLFQEAQTPPWDKNITPFIYHGEQLLAVGSWCSESLTQLMDQNNCQYSWQKPIQIL